MTFSAATTLVALPSIVAAFSTPAAMHTMESTRLMSARTAGAHLNLPPISELALNPELASSSTTLLLAKSGMDEKLDDLLLLFPLAFTGFALFGFVVSVVLGILRRQ